MSSSFGWAAAPAKSKSGARRKPFNRKKKMNMWDVAKTVVRRSLDANTETKVTNYTTQENNPSTTPFLVEMTEIAQGDTQATRTGNELKLTSLWLNMQLLADDDNATFTCRVLVLQVSNQTSITTILSGISGAGFGQLIDLDDCRVLYDRYVHRSVTTQPLDTFLSKKITWPYKYRPRVRYTGSAATDAIKNRIYVCVKTSDDDFVVVPRLRLFFKDA